MYFHFKNTHSRISRDLEEKHEMSKFIIKVWFIHQLMYKWDVLKTILKFKIYIKTAPTCFGTVTPSSGSELLRAY